MASKIFFSHQKVYFWISAFDHRAIILDKMHIVQCDPWGFKATHNAKFPGIKIEIALIAFDITISDLLVCAVALALLHIVSYLAIFYVIWQICLYVTSKSSACDIRGLLEACWYLVSGIVISESCDHCRLRAAKLDWNVDCARLLHKLTGKLMDGWVRQNTKHIDRMNLILMRK